jgi:hypothetical protein
VQTIVIRPAEHLAEGDRYACIGSASLPSFTRFNGSTEAQGEPLRRVPSLYASSGPRKLNWIDGDRQGLFCIQDLAGDPMSVHAQHGLYGTDF